MGKATDAVDHIAKALAKCVERAYSSAPPMAADNSELYVNYSTLKVMKLEVTFRALSFPPSAPFPDIHPNLYPPLSPFLHMTNVPTPIFLTLV